MSPLKQVIRDLFVSFAAALAATPFVILIRQWVHRKLGL